MVTDKDIVDVKDITELPTHYIMFPDDLAAAIKRMKKIEEKLRTRGYLVPSPWKVFRWTDLKGGSMLCVELKRRS